MQGYLPLIQKDSLTLTHGFAVYIKERLPFAQDLSVENVEDFYLFSTGSTSFSLASFSFINHYLFSVLLLFPLSITTFVFVHGLSCYSVY